MHVNEFSINKWPSRLIQSVSLSDNLSADRSGICIIQKFARQILAFVTIKKGRRNNVLVMGDYMSCMLTIVWLLDMKLRESWEII